MNSSGEVIIKYGAKETIKFKKNLRYKININRAVEIEYRKKSSLRSAFSWDLTDGKKLDPPRLEEMMF